MEAEAGMAFCAVAELLKIDGNELLESLMVAYVLSVRGHIVEMASKYPVFGDKYPFVISS